MLEFILGTFVGTPRFFMVTPVNKTGTEYDYRFIDKAWKYFIGNWFLWISLPIVLAGEMAFVFPNKKALLGSGSLHLLCLMVIIYIFIYIATSFLGQNLGAKIACYKNSATVPILVMSWFLPQELRVQMVKALVFDQVATAIIAIALSTFMNKKEKKEGISEYLSLIINPFVITTVFFAALMSADMTHLISEQAAMIDSFKMQYKFLGVANFIHEAGYYHQCGGLNLRSYAGDIALCILVKFTASMLMLSIGPVILGSQEQAAAFAIYLVAAVSSSFLRIVKGLADDKSVRCYIAISIVTHPISFFLMWLVYWIDKISQM